MLRARWVESREPRALSVEVMSERDACCSCTSEAICEESFSRTERASWMQSSRLERRIRASKEEVGWTEWGDVARGL